MVATMSDEDIPMAQCGACNSIIPLDSESCPECNVRFGGTSDQELGECGACQAIIPADSTSCSNCGAIFVEIEANDEPFNVESTIEDESTDDTTSNLVASQTLATQVDLEEVQITEQIEEIAEEITSSDENTDESGEESSDLEIIEQEEELAGDVSETTDDSVTEEVRDTEIPVTVDEEIETQEASDEVDDLSELLNEDEDALEEESSETTTDDLVDELEIEDDGAENVIDDEEVEEEKEPDVQIEDSEIVMAFENLALAIAAKGMTAAEAFGEMDSSDDNLIDAPELQKGIEKIAGEKLIPKHVTAILNYLDKDGNRRVDPTELVNALEDLRIGIQPGKLPKVKTFPSPLQKFLMGKKANDILYPIAYFLMVTFIGLWVVNGMGLLVDGSGGTVVYDGGTDQWGGEITQANWNLCQSDALDEMIDPCQGTVSIGETYPCDPALDPNKCQNSLTPFSGTNGASSMPAGFYGDGIFMIILGVIGLAVTAYLHLIYAPSLREKAKKGSTEEEESSETEDEEPVEESDELDDDDDGEESALEAPVDLEIEDSDDEEDDDEDYDDDDIDVGDWIGLEVDGEEFFGEIIEFDDDEGTVTIETEDGDEVTGDQDDMFLDDE